MNELDRFLQEITRVQKQTHIYNEMFCSTASVDILNKISPSVFGAFQYSLNHEIILSIARLFDCEAYTNSKVNIEYLSQRNLSKKYSTHINEKAKKHKDNTTKIWKELNIKDYRDIVLAHNDKASMVGETQQPKHGVEIKSISELLNESINFIFEIRLSVALENNETSLPIMPNVYRGGNGNTLIKKLKEYNK